MTSLFDITKRPYRHSYSSLTKYKECPFRYAITYLQKLPEEPTAAMDRGTRLHKLCEDYMNDRSMHAPVRFELRKIGLTLHQLRNREAKAEAVWLVDADWNPVTRQEDAKLKAIVDVHYLSGPLLKFHDYKSGREYPSHTDQLEFYAAIGLCIYPDAKRAEGSCLYIDAGTEGGERSLIRDMLPGIRKRWDAVVATLDNDKSFLPVAGGHCKRCPHGVSKGGPCIAEQR